MFWFDGEREVARREFLKRGTGNEEAFDVQVARIEGLHLLSFPHQTINPFGSDRQFLPAFVVAERVLQSLPPEAV